MRIGDLAKIVGVSVATIRYYEQEGLIEKPERSDFNYRRYGSESGAARFHSAVPVTGHEPDRDTAAIEVDGGA